MFIIGFTGTNGAGKTTCAKYLAERQGFTYHSLSDILREELKKKKVSENIDNLLKLGNELRKKFGAGALSKITKKKILQADEAKSIVDSIRHPEEVKELRKIKNFFLIVVDAPIKMRYKRINLRKRKGDNVSFKKFKQQEMAQFKGQGADAQLSKCIKMADYKIVNNSGFEKLYKNVDIIIGEIA
jgi:dephospho-CoA kinase